jgi:hypothetical protein
MGRPCTSRTEIRRFDSNFTSRNLFAGQDIDRRNKEALTQFVLGEQGVLQAEKIATDSKVQAQKTRDLKVLEKGFNGIPNIQVFINTEIAESEVAVESAIARLTIAIEQKTKADCERKQNRCPTRISRLSFCSGREQHDRPH